MTLILEFERKLIFYRPGILRYAMRRAAIQRSAAQGGATRRELLSQSLKHGWDEARAELAALERLQTLMPQNVAGQLRDQLALGANEPPATAYAPRRLQ